MEDCVIKKKVFTKKQKAWIVEKPSGTISVGGNIDARQKKFYNVFLDSAQVSIKKNPNQYLFNVSLPTLKQALDVKEDDKNNTTLKKLIKKLHDVDFEYNILKKDKFIKIEGYASLLDNIKFTTNLKTGSVMVRFSIPEEVRLAMLRKNGEYAKINIVVIKGLKSKYSITLYELAQDYQKVEIPKMSMENFRKIFGINDKYKEIANLRKRVLDVAVDELNNNENIDFFVSYELIKTGKAYTHIKFHIKPKPSKLKLEQQKDKIITQEIQENPDLAELIILVPGEYRTRKNIISLVLGGLEEKGKEYVKAQIEYTNQHAKNNYAAYLKSAIQEDYAGVEVIEGVAVKENDEWKKKYLGKKMRLQGENGLWEIVFVEKPKEDGTCNVRVKNEEGVEVWAVINVDKTPTK